jgi:hypothetical protein
MPSWGANVDNQAINAILLLVVVGAGCAAICLYFSRVSLRKLSAWAESRAAAIDYQIKFNRKSLQRLGVSNKPESPIKDYPTLREWLGL